VGIFDDIKAKGAAYRLTEEALYAEALREIESGQRRDGIWAKAMAESDMDQGKAGAKYIKMRVQSLKDEVTLFIAEATKANAKNDQINAAEVASDRTASQQRIAIAEREIKATLERGMIEIRKRPAFQESMARQNKERNRRILKKATLLVFILIAVFWLLKV